MGPTKSRTGATGLGVPITLGMVDWWTRWRESSSKPSLGWGKISIESLESVPSSAYVGYNRKHLDGTVRHVVRPIPRIRFLKWRTRSRLDEPCHDRWPGGGGGGPFGGRGFQKISRVSFGFRRIVGWYVGEKGGVVI